jgi:hypothetical protein
MATPAPHRCLAPKPLVGTCGRYVYPGEELCPLHTNADRSRVCGVPAGGGISKPPCRSWPVVGRPYCYLHVVPPSGHPIRGSLTGRVSESVTPVDTMRAVVRAADPNALAPPVEHDRGETPTALTKKTPRANSRGVPGTGGTTGALLDDELLGAGDGL